MYHHNIPRPNFQGYSDYNDISSSEFRSRATLSQAQRDIKAFKLIDESNDGFQFEPWNEANPYDNN